LLSGCAGGVWGEAPTSRNKHNCRWQFKRFRGSVATLPLLVIPRYSSLRFFLLDYNSFFSKKQYLFIKRKAAHRGGSFFALKMLRYMVYCSIS
jgi:hypothetical protein